MTKTLEQRLEEILIDPHYREHPNLYGYTKGRKLVEKVLAVVTEHYANQPKSRKWLG